MQKRVTHPLLLAISVGVFGALGAGTRAGFTYVFSTYSSFPIGTWIINAIGSFLLSILFFHPSFRDKIHPVLYTSLTVGAIGSFTTFSTITVETVELFMNNYSIALLYILGNVFTSVIACLIGYNIVKERT